MLVSATTFPDVRSWRISSDYVESGPVKQNVKVESGALLLFVMMLISSAAFDACT